MLPLMSKASLHQSANRKSHPLNLLWLFGQVTLIYIYEQNSGGFLGWHSWV